MAKITSASDYEAKIKGKRQRNFRSPVSLQVHINRLRNAAGVFVEQLISICDDAIKKENLRIVIKRHLIEGDIAGVPGDVLLLWSS